MEIRLIPLNLKTWQNLFSNVSKESEVKLKCLLFAKLNKIAGYHLAVLTSANPARGMYNLNKEPTLELQSRVAPNVEHATTNMVPTQEAIPQESR